MNKPAVRHPVALSLAVVAIFVVSMLVGSFLLIFAPSVFVDNGEFVAQVVAESVVCLAGIGIVALFGYSGIWLHTENFGKGILCGMYIIVISGISAFSGMAMKLAEGFDEMSETFEMPPVEPLWKFLVFAAMCLLVGVAEESFFRGVVANLFWDKHAKDPAGVWTATIYTGLIFGLMHAINLLSSDPAGVVVQMIAAAAMGMAFTAIYYRCKNIWVVVLIHAFLDFCALLPEGVFGGSLSEEIGSYEPIMAITSSVPYIILTFVLLRKKKLIEMLVGDNALPPQPAQYGFTPAYPQNRQPYQQQPCQQQPLIMEYDMPSSPQSRASLTRIAVIAIAVVLVLFSFSVAASGEVQHIADSLTGEATLDYTHSGDWNGERTFGQETVFEVSYSADYEVSIKTLPSESNAYVLIQIKQGDDVVFQENYGGRNSTEAEVHLEKGEYSLILVYNFSEVYNRDAEYYTEVVIK